MNPEIYSNFDASPAPTVWHIGGNDVRLRIPLLLKLKEMGFQIGAAGSEDGIIFAQHGIPYWQYSLNRWVNPVADLSSSLQLFRLFSKHKPDIIHAFDTKPVIYAPLMALQAGVPGRVSTITGLGYLFSVASPVTLMLRPIFRVLNRWGCSASQVTVFQNREDQEYFLDHGMVKPERQVLVPGSGVDIEALLARRPRDGELSKLRADIGLGDHLVVIMIARLTEHKGVREYFEAARLVKRQMPSAEFLLVGPVLSEGDTAIALTEIEENADVVRYLGPRDDVPALLALSDLCVLPSYYREGVPRVLLEAGALGLPLIASDMPGCRDAVQHGWNGLLVPPRDAGSLAEAMLRLLKSREERRVMGSRSQSHISANFSLACIAGSYAEIYRRVLAEAGRGLEISTACSPPQ
jgi:glycosyltransferase involved in cell wall biosynthesis